MFFQELTFKRICSCRNKLKYLAIKSVLKKLKCIIGGRCNNFLFILTC